MVHMMSLPSHHLYIRKIQNDLSFRYWSTRAVLKRLLNDWTELVLKIQVKFQTSNHLSTKYGD